MTTLKQDRTLLHIEETSLFIISFLLLGNWLTDLLTVDSYDITRSRQLSLAIRPWIGAMSTSETWDINGHTARCTSSAYPYSGWRPSWKLRSAAIHGCHAWLEKDFSLYS